MLQVHITLEVVHASSMRYKLRIKFGTVTFPSTTLDIVPDLLRRSFFPYFDKKKKRSVVLYVHIPTCARVYAY